MTKYVLVPRTLIEGIRNIINGNEDVDKLEIATIFFDVCETGDFEPNTQLGELIGLFIKGEIESAMDGYSAKEFRNSPEYRAFKKEVLERDGYKCKVCGSTENLHVHHFKSYRKYPELRADVSNGVTLCANCHRMVHHGDL
jgi:hypothetical protein